MDRNATRQASGGGEIGCAPAGKASTHAAPWAPCTISGNRSIPRRPTPCAWRSTTPGGTWRHRATFSAHGFRLIGRANGSPSASPTWCNVGNAIPTISPRMRSTIWRDELHYEDNGVETRLCPVKPVPSRYHDSANDGLCLHRKGARNRTRGRSMFRFPRNRARRGNRWNLWASRTATPPLKVGRVRRALLDAHLLHGPVHCYHAGLFSDHIGSSAEAAVRYR